ncbi:hypothetical protein ASG32_18640 [Methylobacterium sp. Leaf361]|nr:hypothetical protein ASG32_18640 [Methylobacterium sp. Leaf361]
MRQPIVEDASHFQIKAQTSSNDHLLFGLTAWRDADHRRAEHHIELAPNPINADGAVHDADGHMLGFAQRYKFGAGGFGVVGQVFSSIGSVGTADVARSLAVAADGRPSVAIARAA